MTLAVLAVEVAACGDGSSTDQTPSEGDSAELMASALTHLVSVDHTFGEGPPPFSQYLIEERTVIVDPAPPTPAAVTAVREEDLRRPLTQQERAAIEEAISEYGPVRWISGPDEWRTESLEPEIEGSAILGVDVPRLDEEGALVPVSLWCGGTCGTWLTYRLERTGGGWEVTAVEGPIAIS